jgi:membrane protein
MIKKLLQKIADITIVRKSLELSQKLTLPGFEDHSLYEVSAFFFRGVFKGQLQARAASMAFSFFLAVFPSIIFLFTLIPYVPVPHFQDSLFEVIRSILPDNMFLSLQDAIREITHRQNGGLLSFGVIAALYFSKNGLVAMMNSFNSSIHVRETREQWKQQLIATALVIVLSILIIAGLALMIGSEYMVSRMIEKRNSEVVLISIGKWLLMGLLFLVVIGAFYRFGPARRRHANFFSPGVILAALLTISFSILFSWYVNNFGNYNSVYGSIGTIMVVMLWINFNCMMLLIGFELDAGIYSAKAKKRSLLEQEEAEEAAKEAEENRAENIARNA